MNLERNLSSILKAIGLSRVPNLPVSEEINLTMDLFKYAIPHEQAATTGGFSDFGQIFTAPAGQIWLVHGFSFQLVQAGGTVAPTSIRVGHNVNNLTRIIPFFLNNTAGPLARTDLGLNSTNDLIAHLPQPILVQQMLLRVGNAPDGTLTAPSVVVFFQRFEATGLVLGS